MTPGTFDLFLMPIENERISIYDTQGTSSFFFAGTFWRAMMMKVRWELLEEDDFILRLGPVAGKESANLQQCKPLN